MKAAAAAAFQTPFVQNQIKQIFMEFSTIKEVAAS
jgi:hypothetical protein